MKSQNFFSLQWLLLVHLNYLPLSSFVQGFNCFNHYNVYGRHHGIIHKTLLQRYHNHHHLITTNHCNHNNHYFHLNLNNIIKNNRLDNNSISSNNNKNNRNHFLLSTTSLSLKKKFYDDDDDNEEEINKHKNYNTTTTHKNNYLKRTIYTYLQIMRPITILQAIGAFTVGRLVLWKNSISTTMTTTTTATTATSFSSIITFLFSIWSIFTSYGAGMIFNDCVDWEIDALAKTGDKTFRPIRANKNNNKKKEATVEASHSHSNSKDDDEIMITITPRNAWIYSTCLSMVSLISAHHVSFSSSASSNYSLFFLWTLSNILLMLGYALCFQSILLMKNLVCGWFAISPLLGALFSSSLSTQTIHQGSPLLNLALIGFPIQVAREILKDIEDVEIDSYHTTQKRGKKRTKTTIPMLIGKKASKWFAYGIVYLICAILLQSRKFWYLFCGTIDSCSLSSSVFVYGMSLIIGTAMTIRASLHSSLHNGQKIFKKSIYVLLLGMISALLLQ